MFVCAPHVNSFLHDINRSSYSRILLIAIAMSQNPSTNAFLKLLHIFSHLFRVFLITLKAGGCGLNLTEANHCFLLDAWWNVSQYLRECCECMLFHFAFVKMCKCGFSL